MSEPAIQVENVSKTFRLYHERNKTLKASVMRGRRAKYEDFQALDNVSFEVPEGATFGLIGENGSGKSTLLKCIAKILQPNEGKISLNGTMSALLELGAGFHGELSGRENIYLNGSILGLSRKDIDARFDEIVEFAGGEIPRFIDNPVKNYSSGMFVRLGFAIAINVAPEILLIDEILAVGDEDFQRKCMEKFGEMRRSGRTVVVVSHALDTIRNVCDQAAWLEHGSLRSIGAAGNVVDDYLDAIRDTSAARRPPADSAKLEGTSIIKDVQIIDSTGAATTTVSVGEEIKLRFGLECGTTNDIEILRIGLFRSDGTLISRTSTRDAFPIHERSGYHSMDFNIPQVLIAPGGYHLAVAVVAQDGRTEHERMETPLKFEVVPSTTRHGGGMILLGGNWEIDPLFS